MDRGLNARFWKQTRKISIRKAMPAVEDNLRKKKLPFGREAILE